MPRLCASRPAIVYMATNLINGKRYIGVTSRPLKIRADNHWYCRARTRGHALSRAMAKYGRRMFRFSVLKNCSTYEDALLQEVRLINLLNPDYNLTSGGDGGLGVPKTIVQRARIAKWMRTNGHDTWKASAAAHRKPIICLKDGKIFQSGREAATFYGVSPALFTNHLSGKNATALGMIFSFYTGVESADPLHDSRVMIIRSRQRLDMVTNTSRRPVVCVTTGRRYPSLRHTETETGIPYGCLSRILGKRGLKSWHGLKFEYAI